MKKIFNSTDQKITNLLLAHETQMVVPNYQREYVWSDVEGREFLDDILAQEDKALFLGPFILQQEPDSKNVYIVDGQQRITTILIFLIALRVFVAKHDLSSHFQSDIQRYISFGVDDKNITPRLKPSGRIAKPFEVMCHPDWDGEYTKEMGSRHGWNRIQKPYQFFYNELKYKDKDNDYDENKIRDLFSKIIQIDYIDIRVEESTEAITTFERVNARGQHLAIYDLVKAFLFSKALEDKSLENMEVDWEDIKDYDEKSSLKLQDILLYFYLSKKQYKNNLNLYRELKAIIENDPKKIIDELKFFSRFYSVATHKNNGFDRYGFVDWLQDENGLDLRDSTINNEDTVERITRAIFSLNLFGGKHVYYVIYKSFESLVEHLQKNGDNKTMVEEWVCLLEFFEDFYFITNGATNYASRLSSNIRFINSQYCQEFANETQDFIGIIRTLKHETQNLLSVSSVAFEEEFITLTYQNNNDKKIIQYVFDRLNNTTSAGKRVEPSNASYSLTPEKYRIKSDSIEHILPQTAPKGVEYTEDQKDALHSIGNLLILNSKNNISLGNLPPSEKVEKLQQWLDDGTIQNKQYIQEFLDYYNNIKAQGREWDEKAIEDRGRKLAQRMYEITYYKEKK